MGTVQRLRRNIQDVSWMGEDSSDTEIPDIGDSESLGSSLDEIRRRYDDEEGRRSAIDTKISGLLALNALLLSVVTALPNVGGQYKLLAQIILLLSALLSFSGLVFGHLVWGKYSRPLQHPGQIYSKAQKSKSDFNEDFLQLYTSSSKKNERINDYKRKFLALNFVVTGLAICVIW